MIDEKYIKENPCVAYLAHPYGGNHKNKVETRQLAGSLYEKYPMLTILNPLDNGEYMLGDDEKNIVDHDLELLARCDVLILAPGWEDSEGCGEEFKAAMDKGMDVMLVEIENGDEVSLCPAVYENTNPLADEIQENDKPIREKEWETAVKDLAKDLRNNNDVPFFAICARGNRAGGPGTVGAIKARGDIKEVVKNAQTAVVWTIENIVKAMARDKAVAERLKKDAGIGIDGEKGIMAFTAALLQDAADQCIEITEEGTD